MSDNHSDRSSDQIRRTLADTADEIVVEPADSLAILTAASARRRRRRSVVAGTSIAALAAVGGIVVSTRDTGGDSIQSADDIAAETNTDDDRVGGGATNEADAEAGNATAPAAPPITPPPTLPPLAGSSSVVADDYAIARAAIPAPYGPSQVFAWGDGFLTIEMTYEPQPLPELSDDIVALFPEEIVAIFEPEGLPPTIEEAVERLSEAGYLDEVTTILEDHPEVSEAIYAEPSTPSTTARFSTDGTNWEDINLDVPLTDFGQFGVSGDRLLAWSTPYDPVTETTNTLEIATTTDLATWTLATVELPRAEAVADYENVSTHVNGLAIVGDRWMTTVQQHTWVDYEQLIPADLLSDIEADSAEYGFGYRPSPDGLVIEVCDQLGCNDGQVLTWAELGLEGPPESFDGGPREQPILLTGNLGGDARQLPVPPSVEWGQVQAVGKRFVLMGAQTPFVSVDGTDWKPLVDAGAMRWIHNVIEIDGGALVVGDDDNGPVGVVVADDGTVTDAVLPELPQRYSLWNQNGSAAWVVQLHEDIPGEPIEMEPVTVTVAAEGYDVSLTTDFGENEYRIRYSVLDAGSGDELLTGAVDAETVESEHIVTDPETGEEFFVINDPATGEEFVRVRSADIEQAFDAAYEDVLPEVTEEPIVYEEQWQPDVWLVATRNGIDWLTLDLPDPNFSDHEYGYYPHNTAINGNTVLYSTNDGGWATAQLP